MQRVIQFWRSGIAGKLVIGCGGLVGLLFICVICSVIFGLGDSTRQAIKTPAPTQVIAKTEATAAPIATKAPAATNTPKPTDTPQPTLSPADTVRVAIEKALGSSNRQGVKRISNFSMETGPDPQVFVEWAINDNLTEGLIKSGAQLDITRILKAIAKSGVNYGSVRVQGTFSMVDKFGNAQEMVVVKAVYTRATVERINWDNFLFENVYDIADTKWVHPAFQK